MGNKRIKKDILVRSDCFQKFLLSIPHSKVCDGKTVNELVNDYDYFITGSDQVWNFDCYRPAFFLDFVPSNKRKISYAASISKDSLLDWQKTVFKNSLKSFSAVSVRENSAVDMIKDYSPVLVEHVLDPTLLLEREDYDKACSPRIIQEKYMFCYFIGDNKISRALAEEYAKANGLKVVTLPYLGKKWRSCDQKFGDYKLYSVSPNDFLSLVKHAEVVFTDSFHALVFSHIYQKEYYIFKRSQLDTMTSRLYSLTKLLQTEERLCFDSEKENLDYIGNLVKIDYGKTLLEFEDKKLKSKEFLLNSMK